MSPSTPNRSTARVSVIPRTCCPTPENPAEARAKLPSSPEAGAITAWILRQQADYPAAISLDLHEDNLIHEGYVYSQGVAGAADELAWSAVAVLRESGVPIKMDGMTRFDEPIVRGIIGPVTDSSIDELLSARDVITDGERRRGPGAETVLVLETPAAALPLAQRVGAHASLLKRLSTRLLVTPDGILSRIACIPPAHPRPSSTRQSA